MSDGQLNQLFPYQHPPVLAATDRHVLHDFAPNQQEPLSLASYWYILTKRRWTILGIATVLTATIAVFSFLQPPVYKATARLEIESEAPLLQSQTSNTPYQQVDADDQSMQTEVQLLRSNNLEWETIQDLHLEPYLASTLGKAMGAPGSEQQQEMLINVFDQHLDVDQVPRTRILAVSFQWSDPHLAAQVATKLANLFLDYNFRQKEEAIRRSGWLEQQVEELRQNVEKSQQEMVAYEQANQIVNAGDSHSNILEQQLGEEARDLTTATSERIDKESLYRQVQTDPSQMQALVHDDLLEKLEEKKSELNEQYTQTIAQYGPNFPNAKRLQLEIGENKSQVQAEQQRILERIQNDYNAASNREKMAAANVSRQKNQVGEMNQLLVRDTTLRHDFETNQRLYENALQELKEATISAALRSTNIHLVDSALPPTSPVRPRKLLNTLVALWAGLILGTIAAFAQEAFDSSVKTVEEAEATLLAPAIAVIPLDRIPWHKPKNLGAGDQFALTLTKQPQSPLSEAFRALGTAISTSATGMKTLLITSVQQGEGKTLTSLNLGQALACRRGPVLLIDCDLRKGGVARALGREDAKGLSEVLQGKIGLADALIALEPNFWVLPAGGVPSDPVAMLTSQEFAAVMARLSARFEFIIVDSPPVLAVTDAAILASLVDGVLLVAASGMSPRSGLSRARRILETAGARVLGVALNKMDFRRPEYGYYSKYA